MSAYFETLSLQDESVRKVNYIGNNQNILFTKFAVSENYLNASFEKIYMKKFKFKNSKYPRKKKADILLL